jgi:hypothetical protein
MNKKQNLSEAERYPTVPRTENILGESQRLPRDKPIATVEFTAAFLHVWGKPKAVVLVDKTNTYIDAVV